MKLKNKVAIVTGGSQGIGRAIAEEYATEGATVIIVNARHVDKATEVVTAITASGGKAHAHRCDLLKVDQIQALVKSVIDKFGRIDILVNCAGVLVNKPIDACTEEDWNWCLDINLKGPYFLSQAVVPHMQKQGGGKIICISSVAAKKVFPNVSIYGISKSGLDILVKSFAAEYAKDHINVNGISPGNTATSINQHLQDNPEFVKWIEEHTPTGRAYLSPDEIAGAAVFLASDAAKAIHGTDITIDDGWAL